MKVYVVIGENQMMHNICAHAVYSNQRDAQEHLGDPKRMWFADRAVINEIELDGELNKT